MAVYIQEEQRWPQRVFSGSACVSFALTLYPWLTRQSRESEDQCESRAARQAGKQVGSEVEFATKGAASPSRSLV